MNNIKASRPWFKQPLVWMVIFFPLSAVIGGIITIYLAVESDDGLVEDDYYEQGKAINLVLERDNFAQALGLTGKLIIKDDQLDLRLTAEKDIELPDPLTIKFMSATRDGMDKIYLVPRVETGVYNTPVKAIEDGKWYVEISTPEWRITGTLYMPSKDSVSLGVQK